MKKIKLFKQSLVLFACLTLSSTVLMAQSAAKKPGIKNDPVQLKIAKQEAQVKKQSELKAKSEANGMAYQPGSIQGQPNGARPCVKTTQGPVLIKKATFDRLSPKGQEIINSQPGKYKIVD